MENNPGETPPVLELGGVTKRFGGVTALTDVDFALARGEVHGLVGENGAGKSTAMKIIAGVHTEFEGEYRIDGRPVRLRSTADALAHGIGMVHQELSIVPALSVAENVFLGSQPVNRFGLLRWRHMASQAREHLAALGIDVDPAMRAGDLSIGLQQLVELGRVLFSGARIIILDEPTSALSPPEVKQLFGVIDRLRGQGRSFIFISHFLDDVLEISDSVTIFKNSRRVATARAADLDKAAIIEHMIGRSHQELEETYLHQLELPVRSTEPVVLSARGLGLKGAFEGIDLEVREGEALGIYGFMGCGQLELARALVGKVQPGVGELLRGGEPARLRNTADGKKAGIAIVPESRGSMLFSDVPVYRNISISILERISRWFLKPREERRIAAKQVEDLKIRTASVDALLRTLSGGNQQKVALARWIAHEPKVLVLAEPTRGMDVGAKDDVVKIVRALKERRMGVVVVSTEPETILSLADRIMVMRRGRITTEFAGEPVGKDQLLAAA
ncbi:MAG: sugar ABC transporter ATP-binding protein [Geminicoccaceae bacterium]|nr:sugar ABC transporter ATP-binding protein [Geminicoccaceae bacterium]